MSTAKRRKAIVQKLQFPVFSARLDPDLIAYVRELAEREGRMVGSQLAIIIKDYRSRNGG